VTPLSNMHSNLPVAATTVSHQALVNLTADLICMVYQSRQDSNHVTVPVCGELKHLPNVENAFLLSPDVSLFRFPV
jgi:hypothetical protein